MASEHHSITFWLNGLNAPDRDALSGLYRRVAPELMRMVRQRLRLTVRLADEDDVAVDSFMAFVERLRAGKSLELNSRREFFALLACIVDRRVKNLVKMAKRKEQHVRNEAERDQTNPSGTRQLDSAIDPHEDPREQVAIADTVEHYVTSLPAELVPFARFYLNDEPQESIAQQLGCSLRKVQRNFALIRQLWGEMAQRDFDIPAPDESPSDG